MEICEKRKPAHLYITQRNKPQWNCMPTSWQKSPHTCSIQNRIANHSTEADRLMVCHLGSTGNGFRLRTETEIVFLFCFCCRCCFGFHSFWQCFVCLPLQRLTSIQHMGTVLVSLAKRSRHLFSVLLHGHCRSFLIVSLAWLLLKLLAMRNYV